MDALEICNKLRSEASGVATTGIPLDVFPQKMQQMILDLARTENYSIEFTATSLISAMAAAVGNSCYIRIKGNWILHLSYMSFLLADQESARLHL